MDSIIQFDPKFNAKFVDSVFFPMADFCNKRGESQSPWNQNVVLAP